MLRYFSEIRLAFSNLQSHKLRTFLTMLGMIFGVGAVIAMLSIGAGAEQESLRLIEDGIEDQIDDLCRRAFDAHVRDALVQRPFVALAEAEHDGSGLAIADTNLVVDRAVDSPGDIAEFG